MARIRSVHPDLCASETMAELPANLERTFIRLWTHCDDAGRCVDSPKLIKAAIYPLHEDIPWDVLDLELDALVKAGLIVRYVDPKSGKPVLAVRSWGQYQKPQHPRLSAFGPPPDKPHPPSGNSHEAYGNVHETFSKRTTEGAPVVGEGEGVGDGDGTTPLPPKTSDVTMLASERWARHWCQITGQTPTRAVLRRFIPQIQDWITTTGKEPTEQLLQAATKAAIRTPGGWGFIPQPPPGQKPLADCDICHNSRFTGKLKDGTPCHWDDPEAATVNRCEACHPMAIRRGAQTS